MAKRRDNGEGSVYKRGKHWAGLLSYQDPGTGETERMYFSGKTKQEVIHKIDEAKMDRSQGRLIKENLTLFKDWLTIWLNDYQRPSVKPTTYSMYKGLAELHIIPELGKLELPKITTSHLQRFYNQKLEGGRADGKEGGLSSQTIHHMNKVIRGSLTQAVLEGKILRNPADNVKLPRMKRKPIHPMNKDQVSTFLTAIQDEPLYPVFITAIGTGLRRGEILGLKWKDVDLEKNFITVKRSLLFVDGHPQMQEDTKTSGSKRSVSMPEPVSKALTAHKKRQKEALLKLGHKLSEKDFVFTWESGELISPNYVYSKFKKLLVAHNLPKISFHDLRHTFATILLDTGVHPKIVADMLGHSTVRITLDTYSHVSPDMQARAAEHLGEVLNGKSETEQAK